MTLFEHGVSYVSCFSVPGQPFEREEFLVKAKNDFSIDSDGCVSCFELPCTEAAGIPIFVDPTLPSRIALFLLSKFPRFKDGLVLVPYSNFLLSYLGYATSPDGGNPVLQINHFEVSCPDVSWMMNFAYQLLWKSGEILCFDVHSIWVFMSGNTRVAHAFFKDLLISQAGLATRFKNVFKGYYCCREYHLIFS